MGRAQGLAQLHQFRGRVGRGRHPSTCYLLADDPTPEAEERLSLVARTRDGFALAQADLELRGPGDFFGSSTVRSRLHRSRVTVIDGTNVVTVYDTVSKAVERARGTKGLTIIEAATMRMDGHSLADPFTSYVPAEQLNTWKAKDPIATFKDRLIKARVATAKDLDAIDARVAKEVLDAAIETEQSPKPVAGNIEAEVIVVAEEPGGFRRTAAPRACLQCP